MEAQNPALAIEPPYSTETANPAVPTGPLPPGKLSGADRVALGGINRLGELWGIQVEEDDIKPAIPEGFQGFLKGTKGVLIAAAVLILVKFIIARFTEPPDPEEQRAAFEQIPREGSTFNR